MSGILRGEAAWGQALGALGCSWVGVTAQDLLYDCCRVVLCHHLHRSVGLETGCMYDTSYNIVVGALCSSGYDSRYLWHCLFPLATSDFSSSCNGHLLGSTHTCCLISRPTTVYIWLRAFYGFCVQGTLGWPLLMEVDTGDRLSCLCSWVSVCLCLIFFLKTGSNFAIQASLNSLWYNSGWP